MKRNKSVLCAAIALIMLIFFVQLSITGNAVTEDMSITVVYKDGEPPLTGAVFNLFYVATVEENGKLTVTDTFSDYNVDLNIENGEAWQIAALTLEGYVLRDEIAPNDSGATNSDGILVFSTDGRPLQPGLYLVTGEAHTQNSKQYNSAPFLVALPSEDTETGEADYNPTVMPKFDFSPFPNPDEPGDESYKVVKIWRDSGLESIRPQEITIDLLKDGVVFDTVKLNSGNNWTYRWDELESGHRYTAVERTADGYTVTVEREGTSFVIINTHSPSTPEEPTAPNEPSQPGNPNQPNQPGKPNQPTLPQTGQLWWPVPMLAIMGIAFVLIGMLRRKNGRV